MDNATTRQDKMNHQEQQLKLKFAKRKRAIQWVVLLSAITATSFSIWKWYTTSTNYTAEASICIEGERTPSDFWTNTGLVSATTKATEVIRSESFISSVVDTCVLPAPSFVLADYKTISNTKHFPFEISVTKRADNFDNTYTITDAGDSSFLIKSIHGKSSTLATFGYPVDIDGYTIIANRKTANLDPFSPSYTPVEYAFTLQSKSNLTLQMLQGEYQVEASQINDVIKVQAKSQNNEVAAAQANVLAQAYIETLTTNTNIESITVSQENEKVEAPATENNKDFENLSDELSKLESEKEQQDLLSRNIRERIESDFSQMSLEGIDSETIERNMEKLGSLYVKLESDPGNSNLEEQIRDRKGRITEELIELRKSTAKKIERVSEELKTSSDNKDVETTALTPQKTILNQQNQASKTTFVAATPMTAEAETSTWLWISLIGLSLVIVSIKRVVSSTANVQLAKAEAGDVKTLSVPTLVSTVKSTGKDSAPFQSVQNLCTELLSVKNAKLISLSSLHAGEGKTYVATHLGVALASLDKKVLIVALSVNNSRTQEFFDVEPEATLSGVIAGKYDILQSVVQTAIPGLDMIAAGSMNHGIMSFLSWAENEATIKQLKNYYDYILIDTDDISQSPGALAIMNWCDLNLVLDSACGKDTSKTTALAKIFDKKNLINTFVVHNYITERKERKQPSKKTNTTNDVKTEQTLTNSTVNESVERSDEQIKKPSVLKRVALWFF